MCKVLLKIMSSLKKTLPRMAGLALENQQKFRDVRIGISLSKKNIFFPLSGSLYRAATAEKYNDK